MLEDVFSNTPQLWEGYAERKARNPERYYIDAEDTSKKEAEKAWQMIRAKDASKGGRPPREKLVAVECANLVDHGWSCDELAERYGWQDPLTANKYVRQGRNLLSKSG